MSEIKERERKATICAYVGIVAFIILLVGIIHIQIYEIEINFSNIWITFWVVSVIVLVFIGMMGLWYRRNENLEFPDWNSG